MTRKERIEWNKQQEQDSVKLAANHVKDKNWIVAADLYRAASFHRALWKALQERS